VGSGALIAPDLFFLPKSLYFKNLKNLIIEIYKTIIKVILIMEKKKLITIAKTSGKWSNRLAAASLGLYLLGLFINLFVDIKEIKENKNK
jgi:hypothetical protein